MMIRRFENSVFKSNSYIIDNDGSKAVIIDIGDFAPLQEYMSERRLEPAGVLITHTHYDHIYGIKEFMDRYPDVEIYTSEFGKMAFSKPNINFSRYHDDFICIESDKIVPLKDNDVISIIDNLRIKVIATPGHDMSCLSYTVEDNIFTGDSYIPGIKVVDTFPKSDKELARHWYGVLQEMARTRNVYPGHGPEQILTNR